jgi:nicotinamidase/pyrazinamidase
MQRPWGWLYTTFLRWGKEPNVNIEDHDALLVVDVQNDFCPGGALPVPDGDKVVPVINGLLLKFRTVFFTRDYHPSDHCSFSETPEYRDMSWPPHCVQHTPGAEFHGDLHVPADATVISKGTDPDKEAYSGFSGTALHEELQKRKVRRVFVTGLATEYCVKETALDAARHGYETYVVEDACRGLTSEGVRNAVHELKSAGVGLVHSSMLM